MYNDYSFATSHEDFAVLFGMFSGIFLLILGAFLIFFLIVQWKLFSKAGDKGWKVLIPVYGMYTQYKLFWNTRWFWIMFLLGVATSVTGTMLTEETAVLMTIVSIVAAVMSFIISIVYCVKLARSFGRAGGFAAGLIFLPVIFMPILAFSRDAYVGPGGDAAAR